MDIVNKTGKTPLLNVMNGVTISCPEPQLFSNLLTEIFGWEILDEGSIDKKLENLWGINSSSSGNHWIILKSPDSIRGMIRIVKGAERNRTRPIGTRWSGVEIVVMQKVDEVYAEIVNHSLFEALSTPTTFDFSDVGANIHRGFHGKGPGKTHLMFTMEVTKPTAGYEFPSSSTRVGHIFSVPLVSNNYTKSLNFYTNELNMISVLTDHLEEGLWHSTWNLPTGTPVDISILKGNAPGFGHGGIELQGYSKEFIDPIPYNKNIFDGGTCLTSYTTDDIEGIYTTILNSPNALSLSEPETIPYSPYNGCKAFCFLGPSGERLEIMENGWV